MRSLFSSSWLGNILWFFISLILAFSIWVIANFQVDPIQEQRFPRALAIQIRVDDGMIVTERSRDNAMVTLRAQESVMPQIQAEDISVVADLRGYPPGEYTVDLQSELPATLRAVVSDITPRRVRVLIETRSEQLVPVDGVVEPDVPTGYERDEITFSASQVLVSGPSSLVSRVVAVQVRLDLSTQRASFEQTADVVSVDAQGQPVTGVTAQPAQVTVSVAIRQNANFREVRIAPNILADTLPEGYFLTALSYEPQTVLLTGAPEALANLPATLRTEPIDLTQHTDDFQITVNIVLPRGDFVIVSGESVTIDVGIDALTSSRNFDAVPVTVIGLGNGLEVTLSTQTLAVLVTGPQQVVQDLTVEDLQIVLDLTGVEPGSYQRTPVASVMGSDVVAEVALLPPQIDVVVTDGSIAPTAEATPAD